MNEMVERVARALATEAESGCDPDQLVITMRSQPGSEPYWMSFLAPASVAIAAMREPTESMLVAARDWSHAKYGKPVGNDGATGCWRAMIDAALME